METRHYTVTPEEASREPNDLCCHPAALGGSCDAYAYPCDLGQLEVEMCVMGVVVVVVGGPIRAIMTLNMIFVGDMLVRSCEQTEDFVSFACTVFLVRTMKGWSGWEAVDSEVSVVVGVAVPMDDGLPAEDVYATEVVTCCVVKSYCFATQYVSVFVCVVGGASCDVFAVCCPYSFISLFVVETEVAWCDTVSRCAMGRVSYTQYTLRVGMAVSTCDVQCEGSFAIGEVILYYSSSLRDDTFGDDVNRKTVLFSGLCEDAVASCVVAKDGMTGTSVIDYVFYLVVCKVGGPCVGVNGTAGSEIVVVTIRQASAAEEGTVFVDRVVCRMIGFVVSSGEETVDFVVNPMASDSYVGKVADLEIPNICLINQLPMGTCPDVRFASMVPNGRTIRNGQNAS